jgi:hypothetical protein
MSDLIITREGRLASWGWYIVGVEEVDFFLADDDYHEITFKKEPVHPHSQLRV